MVNNLKISQSPFFKKESSRRFVLVYMHNVITILILMLLLSSCVKQNNLDTIPLIKQYEIKQQLIYPNNKKIILVGGCFDVLHYGHLEFFRLSKLLGDILVVALEPDTSIVNYKNRLPIHNQIQRAQNLAAIKYIDQILLLPALQGFDDYNCLVQDVKPHIIAITNDDPQIQNKQRQARSINAVIKVVTNRLNFSTSNILYKQKYNNCFRNKVIKGKQEARKYGFPTANILVKASQNFKEGVYDCIIYRENIVYNGMCYYTHTRKNILEAHLFDYTQNLYDQEIKVCLVNFIRSPYEYINFEQMQALIKNDADNLRK